MAKKKTARHKTIGAARYFRYKNVQSFIDAGLSIEKACAKEGINRWEFYHVRSSLAAGAKVAPTPRAPAGRPFVDKTPASVANSAEARRAYRLLYLRLYMRLRVRQRRGFLLGVPNPSIRGGKLHLRTDHLNLLTDFERLRLFPARAKQRSET